MPPPSQGRIGLSFRPERRCFWCPFLREAIGGSLGLVCRHRADARAVGCFPLRKLKNVRNLLQGNTGLLLAVLLLVGGGTIFYITVLAGDGVSEIAEDSRTQTLIDADGNVFTVKLSLKSSEKDLVNPKSGKTGYPAEWCWWTKDGKKRDKPFPVLLNQHKGDNSPTFCPDCDRLVIPHNPQYIEGLPVPKLPPTKQEYGTR